jgi:uncharacterized protein
MMVSRIFKMKITRFAVSCGLLFGALSLYGADQEKPTAIWHTMETLNSDLPITQQKNAAVLLDGKTVSIPGFMVPLEDDLDKVTEFLLVPYAGACIHVPPPPPNQMVYVEMKGATKVKVTFTDPIMVTGQLKISTVVSPYGDVSYDMVGMTIKPFQQ